MKELAITDVQGDEDGYPQCDWDFFASPGALKITANCPAAHLTITGQGLDSLQQLLDQARGK